jgi:hypothetical protein
MGKKSEKHFKENELFLFFWGAEEALPDSDRRFGRERPR